MRFELLNELGRGGFGLVYLARDHETNEIVALKQLRPDIASRTDVVDRFKKELLLTRKVTHRNVCRVHDLYRVDDAVFISMEYVEGESLRARLSRAGRLPVVDALSIVHQIIDGLEEAHRQRIIHRDLKPENIMIAVDGTVKIMDFGIARAIDSEVTTLGAITGTPAYMSPEQALCESVDERSDIYSLGLIVYEMVCGQQAFTGDSAVSVAMKHVNEAPVAPRQHAPDLPEFVEAAILKCVEKDRTHRFASVGLLRAALRAAGAETSQTSHESMPVRVGSTSKGLKWTMGALVAGVLLVASVSTMFSRAGVTSSQLSSAPSLTASFAGQQPSPAALPASTGPTIAVLDFDNLQKDSQYAHLERGIAETFTASFVRSKRFRVVERAQIEKVLAELRFNRTEAVDQSTAQQLGRIVGAQYLVVGSFQVFRGQARINARLLRVETGEVVGTDAVTGDLSSALTMPDRLAERFLSQLE